MEKLISNALRESKSTVLKTKRMACAKLLYRCMPRNDTTLRNMSYLSRITSIQPNKLYRQFKLPMSRNDYFRDKIFAVTSLLIKSPMFACILNSEGQRLQLFNSSGIKSNKDSSQGSNKGQTNDQSEDEEQEENENDHKTEMFKLLAGVAGLIFGAYLLSSSGAALTSNIKFISWNEFYQHILITGEVKSIDIRTNFRTEKGTESIALVQVQEGAVIKGTEYSDKMRFAVKVPEDFNIEEKIRQFEDSLEMGTKDRIPIIYTHPRSWLGLLFGLVPLMLLALPFMFSRGPKKSKERNMNDFIDFMSGGIRQAKFTRVDIASRGKQAISFKDVAGLKEAKVEIVEFVDYLTNPQRYKNLGAKTPRGAILLGPPGCGKTLLARALASEAKVPFLAMAGSEFVEMIGGVGAARVRSLFKEARKRAPCIIYIDEIDAIGRSRGGAGSSTGSGEDEHTLNQLLVEMDGMGTQEGVILIAATNRADILDKALLRPGRFDRQIMIDLPTLQEREEIFKVYLEKLKMADSAAVYSKPLARLTPGMSGADINNICNEAAIYAARNGKKIIVAKDFHYAVERVLAGVEKKTNHLSPGEKKVVAYHESGHALVGWLLEHTDALLRISIVPRTNSMLGFTQYLPTDQHLYSQQALFERMCMALGGRAAESLIFNHVTTGAHDDLRRVTEMAYNQIRSYGMNPVVGHLSFPSQKEQPGQRPYSQRLTQIIDEEANRLVTKAFLHTQKVLQDNKDKLHSLATTLLEKEVLSYEEIEGLIGPPPHGKKQTMETHGWEGIVP